MKILKKVPILYWKKMGILILISLFLAFVYVLFWNKTTKDILKEIYHSFGNSQETIVLKEEDMVPKDYDCSNHTYTALSSDPWFTARNVNCEISRLDIFFAEPLKQGMYIQIYYTLGTESFNAKAVIQEYVDAGRTKARIYFTKEKIQSLRIDIGIRKGVTFTLDQIVINGKRNMKALWEEWKDSIKNTKFNGYFFNKIMLVSLIFIFIGLHFILNISDFYYFLFKNRWAVGGILLLFLVINKYNGDSVSMYDHYVQRGEGSEYIEPILGEVRSIRSDEWLIANPIRLGIIKEDSMFEKYSQTSGGADTLNAIWGMRYSLSMLAYAPFNIVYAILPLEYAYSFIWYFQIILSFLISIEMGLILSKGNKLLSVLCGILLACSPWYLWWGFPMYFISAQGCIVCANYFLNTDKRREKILYAVGIMFAFSVFVTNTYPAWQVPVGYVFLAILIWFIHKYKDKIQKMNKEDIVILTLCAIGSLILIASYFLEIREYSNIIMNTVYPGKRRVYGGEEVPGGEVPKLFYYFQSVFYPYVPLANPSAASGIISLFPIPMAMSGYLFIKQKKKDWLVGALLIVSIVLILYTAFPVSELFGDLTLLSYSMPKRCADIVGWVNVYLLIRILSYPSQERTISLEYSVPVIIVSIVLAEYFCTKMYPEYLSKKMGLTAMLVYILIALFLFTFKKEKYRKKGIILLAVIGFIAGIGIRPIVKGLDGIYSKPAAEKIQEIIKEDKNGKWLATSEQMSSFLVACGAPTLTSVNAYPNLQLWRTLDPEGNYENVYNRYAHIQFNLIEENTYFEIKSGDVFILYLSYNDIPKTEASYFFTSVELSEIEHNGIFFDKIYDEKGAYIYKINYGEME